MKEFGIIELDKQNPVRREQGYMYEVLEGENDVMIDRAYVKSMEEARE